MAKRFTATEKWIDPWFCGLLPNHKLFWIYLLDNCDHAGIWQVNWKLVRFHIPGKLNEETLNGRIVRITAEKWFLPKFIDFQYGDLNPDSRTHQSVINILKKEGVWEGYTKGMYTLKDKGTVTGTDKGTDMDKDSEKKGNKTNRFVIPSLQEVQIYQKEINKGADPAHFIDFYQSKGWKVGRDSMTDWKAAYRNSAKWDKKATDALDEWAKKGDQEDAKRNIA